MSKSKVKYYAVKEGKDPGIYISWSECKKQVVGHSGALYKSFPTLGEAENYLSGIEEEIEKEIEIKDIEKIFVPSKDINYIFCDGSEIKGTEKAGYGVYYPRYNIEESFQLTGGTNNQAEIKAVLRAFLRIALAYNQSLSEHKKRKYIIVSDSKYVINSILEWIPKWKMNSWKKSDGKIIENLDLIKELDSEYQKLLGLGLEIEFLHLNSHQKKPLNKNSLEYYLWYGNYMVDLLAKK